MTAARMVFADTGYYIAMSNDRDQWHRVACDVTARLGTIRIVTSRMMVVEFLNYMARRGQRLREDAVALVRDLADDPGVEIVPQSDAQFDSAFNSVLFTIGQELEPD